MEFELLQDSSGASQQQHDDHKKKKQDLDGVLSDFTFSEQDEADEDRVRELIDLAVPVSYKVKFNFTPEKVMMRLSKDRLRRLNKVWEQSEEGLTLSEFMKLMILEVPSLKEEKLEMINGLIKLFKQVDINGDQMMQWSEFVQYMIDQVLSESIMATQDVQGNVTSIGAQIRMQQAGKFHRMKRSGVPLDKGRHRNTMLDVIMCPDQRNKAKTVVMHSEQDSTTVQWYSLDMKPITQMQVPVKKKTAKVLHIAHQDLSTSLYSFGPQGTDAVYGVLCADHTLYLYIRNRGRIELFYQIDTGPVAQGRVWFMKKHKAWLTAGVDFKIRQWNISPLVAKHEVGDPIQLHSDFVTDCVEISSPLCIATCGLDRTIVLYDLKNGEALRRFSRKHVTGVRHMRYMEDFGGILISVGYEIYANVWGPQNLFGNAHLGRLKGHRCPIVHLDVLQSRPFVFTLDNTNELIIWDIRNLTPLQIIPAPNQKEKLCHGVLAIHASLLWVYGSRFITYDKQEVLDQEDFDVGEVEDQSTAINAFHNQFFQTICVQTPQDLKIYSCLDGQLMVMHQSVFKHPHVNCTQIYQDKRHRKAYLASNNGKIDVINIQSGVLLKSVFEEEDEQKSLENKQKFMSKKIMKQVTSPKVPSTKQKKTSPRVTRPPSMESLNRGGTAGGGGAFLTEAPTAQQKPRQKTPGQQTDNDSDLEFDEMLEDAMAVDGIQKREIVDMILVWEYKMNQMIYADKSSYYVYDEADEKQSQQVRRVTGAHKSNITVIKFSYFLSLIATGTETGEVAVWDYELSQLLGICQGHSPTTGAITAIEFMQPYPLMVTAGEDSRVCLWAVRPTPNELCYVTIGIFYNVSFNYDDDSKYPVRTLLGHSGKMKGISRGVCMKHSQINSSIYRDYKTTQVLATKEAAVKVDNKGNFRGLSQMQEIRLGHLKEALKTDENGNSRIENQFESMRVKYLPRMELLDPEYDEKIDEEKMRIYLYLGDDFGIMKIWDLTYFLENSQLKPCKPVWEVRGDQYFPNRTEAVNVSSYSGRLRKNALQNYQKNKMQVKDPEDSGMIIRECVAHEKPFKKLNPHNFDGLMSVGADQQVRIWSHGLDLWGIIDTTHYRGDVLWYFPTKDREERENADIGQMQILADQLREQDEQAVLIERDVELAKLEENHFTEGNIYSKMNGNFEDKRRIKREAEVKEQNAIIQERREWNLALQAAKPKPPVSIYKQEAFNKNLRAIERIEEHGVAEDQLYDRIFFKEKSQYEIKGEVVVETSNKIDALIAQALRQHGAQPQLAIDTAGSPKRSPRRNLFGRRQNQLTSSRNVTKGIVDGSSPVSSKSPSSRNVTSTIKKKQSSTNLSLNGSPKSPAERKKTLLTKRLSQISPFQQGAPDQSAQNSRKVSDVASEATTPLINLQRVTSTTQVTKLGATQQTTDSNKTLAKKDGSSMSLNKDESNQSRLNNNTIVTIPEESETMAKPNAFAERTLDQLNKTKTLMRKVEESTQQNKPKMEQYVDDKEYLEDTMEDRKHLLAMKNLPSIRDKLFSIKTKQQRANLNPKYNGSAIIGKATQPIRSLSTLRPSVSKASAPQVAAAMPYSSAAVPLRKLDHHYTAMNELATVARDLEKYNKNRYFNQRARSLLIEQKLNVEQRADDYISENQYGGIGGKSSASRLMHNNLLSAEKSMAAKIAGEQNLWMGQEDIISQGSRGAGSGLAKNLEDSYLMQKGQIMSQLLVNDDSLDADGMTKQLREFQSQLLARDATKREDRLKLRNLANSRTPNNYKRTVPKVIAENLSLERLRKNPSQFSKLQVELPQMLPYANQPGLMGVPQGPQITYSRADLLAGGESDRKSGITLELSNGRQGRNANKKIFKTNEVPKSNTDLLKAKMEEIVALGGGNSSAQLSSQFKKKVLGGKYNDANTAAQSVSIEHTLEKDASRQYLDINFSIGDSVMQHHTKPQEATAPSVQVPPGNMSISNLSIMAETAPVNTAVGGTSASKDSAAMRRINRGPISLYSDNKYGDLQQYATDPSFDQIDKHSHSVGRHKVISSLRSGPSWKAKRRQSEQTRFNEATGMVEQVNIDEQKKNQYLALKQKYTGKEAGLNQLYKREAENIQRQRERINELSNFKSVMRNLKGKSVSIDSKGMTE